MKKFLLFTLLLFWHLQAAAALTIEITEGAEGSLPIAVVPFGWEGTGTGPGQQIARIIKGYRKQASMPQPARTAASPAAAAEQQQTST